MNYWTHIALTRIAGFFIGGILIAIYWPTVFSIETVLIAVAFCVLLYVGFYIFLRRSRWLGVLSGSTGLLAIFLCGFVHIYFYTDTNQGSHLSHFKEDYSYYTAKVLGAPEEKSKSWKLEVSLIHVGDGEELYPVTGKILLYVSKLDFQGFGRGDIIYVRGKPSELKGPANPNEFDFKRFLSFKNIFHQQFVTADKVIKIGESRADLISYSQKIREKAAEILKHYVAGKDEQAVALALVLGVRDALDNDLQQAYASSGAMHVLAVSGLHVGIVYLIILFAFKPLKKYAWSRWVIAIFSILILWSYAFMTGLSPSVLRAVTMFSFFALAKPFGHRTNIYNTLAASAFVLLLVNPYLIMSVGFQLSYLAVLGIVYVQAPLYRLWEIDNAFGDWVWKITTVSIAAQLATFALGLLYFHQFPVYFLFSNLFVIPGAFVILLLGIGLLTFSFWSLLAAGLGKLLSLSIFIVNKGVFFIEGLPFSLLSDIYISTFQSWLLIGIVVFLLLVFDVKRFQFMYGALVLSVAFLFTQYAHHRTYVNPASLSVYSVNGHGAIDFIHNSKSYLFTDSALLNDEDRIRFHIRPNRVRSGVRAVEINTADFNQHNSGLKTYYWQEEMLVWIDQPDTELPDVIQTDYLVIGNNAVSSLHDLMEQVKPKNLILDGSNTTYYSTRLKKEAGKLNIPVHDVNREGAFHKVYRSP